MTCALRWINKKNGQHVLQYKNIPEWPMPEGEWKDVETEYETSTDVHPESEAPNE